jgi:hypothetical protein
MSGDPVERRLAAILAADVAGCSRLIGADEEGTLERLKTLRAELIAPKIAEHKRPRGQDHRRRALGRIYQCFIVHVCQRCASVPPYGLIGRTPSGAPFRFSSVDNRHVDEAQAGRRRRVSGWRPFWAKGCNPLTPA